MLQKTFSMREQKAYHKLIVWQKAHEFAKDIYQLTARFPREEQYGLTSQLRRAAVSVAANIVEGQAKSKGPEFVRFLTISKGSLAESEYYLELALELAIITKDEFNRLEQLRQETAFLLHQLIESLRR
ncbi:four helix bundle protein [Patescibacteria group bacterium]|nr:MAG: four helix bundle protein [Patescibacteria group bacterium]